MTDKRADQRAAGGRSTVSLVVGCRGQDGHYLSELLQARGDHVIGIARGGCWSSQRGEFPALDVRDRARVATLLAEHRPDEIYYLAGVFDSSEAAAQDPYQAFQRSHDVHVVGWHNFLDGVERQRLPSRLFYASSSRVFGDPAASPQTELTPLAPLCLYGITKSTGMELCSFYRRLRGVFCSSGILYNHESPRRPPAFVSRKIVQAAVDIKLGAGRVLSLGNLSATVDWGAAQDYVDAMARILALGRPDDFVIASGEPHSVKQFAEAAFGALAMPWERHVIEDPSLLAPAPAKRLVLGDATRLREATGWRPKLDFQEMVRQMIDAEFQERKASRDRD
jgi:GDPmannose 4,6-dehydratase